LIAVVGEALIDLVAGADGRVDARPGGGPYNAARTLARLGAATTFVGRLADDSFGRLLHDGLAAEGVVIGVPEPSAAPTTLALADVDQAGIAKYGFYLTGTAAADLGYDDLSAALPADVFAVHVGTLGLVMEPVGSAIERLVLAGLPPGALVLLDPNCRPSAIADRAAYLGRLGRLARRADVVKASVEDLAYLRPGESPGQAAAALLAAGQAPATGTGPAAGPALILVTDGPRPAMAVMPDGTATAEVPGVRVADTIGAGDAFGGAFLAWWAANGLGRSDLKRPELVAAALCAAVAVAALTCSRPGADPPTLATVQSQGWWPTPAP
jgi:fructokinase